MVHRILTEDQKKRCLQIASDILKHVEVFLIVMKCGVSSMIQTQHAVENQGSALPKETMHVLFSVQNHAVLFFSLSQGHSSLEVPRTWCNGQPSLLLGNSEKVTEICSEEKTSLTSGFSTTTVFLHMCSVFMFLDHLPSLRGKINSQVYENILQDNIGVTVCPQKLSRSWAIQQDHNVKHQSKSTTDWLEKKKIHLFLEWPSQRPELN